MKYKYFYLILITFLSFNKVNSQACPEISFVVALTPEEVIFVFDLPGPPCIDRPGAIVIDGSAFLLGNCDEFSSRYVLTSGSGVIDPNSYTVTYGSSTCQYINGTLGLDEILFINKKTLQLYPNPIRNSNVLNVKFALNMSAKINVYSLNGKLVLRDQLNNSKFKDINISNLSNGIFLLRLETDNASITKKFIVQN
jgi:Secretion system C-terminal sorting domain